MPDYLEEMTDIVLFLLEDATDEEASHYINFASRCYGEGRADLGQKICAAMP